jgi:hypothetical protein
MDRCRIITQDFSQGIFHPNRKSNSRCSVSESNTASTQLQMLVCGPFSFSVCHSEFDVTLTAVNYDIMTRGNGTHM